jgi:hypothetical protein
MLRGCWKMLGYASDLVSRAARLCPSPLISDEPLSGRLCDVSHTAALQSRGSAKRPRRDAARRLGRLAGWMDALGKKLSACLEGRED